MEPTNGGKDYRRRRFPLSLGILGGAWLLVWSEQIY